MLTGWPWRQAGLRISCACMRRRRQYIYGAPRPVHGHRYQQSPQGFHISQARSVPEISRAASPVFNYYLLRAGKWIAIKTARSRHSIPCVFVSSETTHCPAQQIESMLGNALSQRQIPNNGLQVQLSPDTPGIHCNVGTALHNMRRRACVPCLSRVTPAGEIAAQISALH